MIDTEMKDKDYRTFAIIVTVGVILFQWLYADIWLSQLTYAMGGFLAIGLVLPKLMKFPYVAWLKIGGVLGYINIRLILGFTFYLMMTPLAIWFRLIGRDKLNLKRPNQDSYWEDYDAHPKTVERYRKLF